MSIHALSSPGYLDKVHNAVANDPKIAGVLFDDLRENDVVRFAGEDHMVVELSRDEGWMVLMDSDDHCTVVRDCKDDRFHRAHGYA